MFLYQGEKWNIFHYFKCSLKYVEQNQRQVCWLKAKGQQKFLMLSDLMSRFFFKSSLKYLKYILVPKVSSKQHLLFQVLSKIYWTKTRGKSDDCQWKGQQKFLMLSDLMSRQFLHWNRNSKFWVIWVCILFEGIGFIF